MFKMYNVYVLLSRRTEWMIIRERADKRTFRVLAGLIIRTGRVSPVQPRRYSVLCSIEASKALASASKN
ncbi:hypothetical protein Ae706Ps2_6476c [Pseudonocardia sp. Ae706_Ps2]|nr:hypothetical protein Ae331Ps2_6263 [Pseudonocardia sp. Ae331_Ps2]OLM08350.1 hypothetical protein Ae505Ps2_6204 [Pseudonocardia sp. Ae505_Ps2]OLM09376.1 hypothetical protein Ae706Ps2_6476c [Pseudonocardia sp. Ae706_Ps2]